MKRTIEAEMTVRTKNVETVINRFFKKFPELDYWREEFKYLAENNKDFECDNLLADGTENKDWAYALHLDVNEDIIYMCVIERV